MTARMHNQRLGEASFTLVETIIALGIMAFIILEVSGVQGNAIYFADYGRKVSQASMLAKRVLAQVEYLWNTRDFKDLEQEVPPTVFADDKDFSYQLTIKEWKLPLVDMLTGGGGGEGGEEKEANPMAEAIKNAVNQVFGEDLLKTATVEVSWAEGAKRNSTSITYLLTNQRKADQELAKLEPVYKEIMRKIEASNKPPGQPVPGNPVNPAGQVNPANPENPPNPGG